MKSLFKSDVTKLFIQKVEESGIKMFNDQQRIIQIVINMIENAS